MKPHLILRLSAPLPRRVPYWEDFIFDKGEEVSKTHPSIDDALANRFSLSYWVTENYRPAKENWAADEIKAGLNRIYRIILRNVSKLPPSLINEISLLPEVVSARAGEVAQTQLPGISLASSLPVRVRYRQDTTDLATAHLFTRGHSGITIAVLDTGFKTDHPEIAHSMLPGKDFVNIIDGADHFVGDFLGLDNVPEDEVGHGTHVAGIIAGKGDRMPVGVAPACKILPVKVLGALRQGNQLVGAGLIENINAGIKYAVDAGADVINMSLGIRHTGGGLPHEPVIRYALARGVTVVAASGNDGREDKYYPGAIPGVIAVGAADEVGRVAPFSTYGPHVSLTAPGVNIFSSHLQDGYAYSSGTSQAAPVVAGSVALLKSFARVLGRNLPPSELRAIFRHTSYKSPGRFRDRRAGYGCLQISDALKMLRQQS